MSAEEQDKDTILLTDVLHPVQSILWEEDDLTGCYIVGGRCVAAIINNPNPCFALEEPTRL